MEYGTVLGLAQSTQADQRINDLRYQEQLKKQAAIEAANKAKMFEDDTDYKNAMNVFDNPIIKAKAQATIKELGRFMNENPDWETNAQKRLQRKEILGRLKDDPDLNRGLSSDTSFKQFQADLATKSKDPNVFDEAAYKEVMQQWKNYEKYGNQFATDGVMAQKLGRQAFVYQQPQDLVDLNKEGLEYGNKFNKLDVKKLQGGGSGSYRTEANEEALTALATDMYQRNKRTMDLRFQQAGYKDQISYAKELIRAGVKTSFDMGDIVGDRRLAMEFSKAEKTPPKGTWEIDVVNKDASVVPGEILKDALGAKPAMKIPNKNGSKFVDLTGLPFEYTGRNKYFGDGKQKGIKHFEGITQMDKDEAISKGFVVDKWGDDEVADEWKNNVYLKTIKNSKGEEREIIEVRFFSPFEINNSTSAGIYEQKSTTSKYVTSPQEDYQTRVPMQVVQNGITYTYNESTGQYE